MELLFLFVGLVGVFGGLSLAALKFGVDSRTPELLKEKSL